MGMTETYASLDAAELPLWARARKAKGWRFVQMCARAAGEGAELLYTLRRGSELEQRLVAVPDPDAGVPSVTGEYLAAFVFENEAHDLFGVRIDGMAIDFHGKFYRLAEKAPMATRAAGGKGKGDAR